MTSAKERTHSFDKSRLFNRFMYGAFVLLSAYYLIIGNDLSSAVANLGIGLIFDFNIFLRGCFSKKAFYMLPIYTLI